MSFTVSDMRFFPVSSVRIWDSLCLCISETMGSVLGEYFALSLSLSLCNAGFRTQGLMCVLGRVAVTELHSLSHRSTVFHSDLIDDLIVSRQCAWPRAKQIQDVGLFTAFAA